MKSVGCIVATTRRGAKETIEVRYLISSLKPDARRLAEAARAHWGVEDRQHWVLDVVFAEDLARLRTGHGAKNMAVVRHFAINLARQINDKRTIKLRRKLAGWNDYYLASILTARTR